MRQDLVIAARGLNTAQSQIKEPNDGRLLRADNVVVGREGIWEQRRGVHTTATFPGYDLDMLSAYRGRLVLHSSDGRMFTYEPTSGASSTIGGTFAPPSVGHLRTLESNGNLYISAQGGVRSIDGFTAPTGSSATPFPAGMPSGLDVSASIFSSSLGTALPGNSQVAYRFVFGRRDRNQNLLLGSPSGRGIVSSPSYLATPGLAVRAGSTVTVTVANDLHVGEIVQLVASADNEFPAGTFTVTAADATSFKYVQAGNAVANTSSLTYQKTSRNVAVGSTIPPGLQAVPDGYGTSPYFFQVYRSRHSLDASVPPDDELGFIYEGSIPIQQAAISMSRASNVVSVTSSSPHGFNAGETVYLPIGFAGATSSVKVEVAQGTFVGGSTAATSSDGVTWTFAATAPSAMVRVVSTPTQYVAVGFASGATSVDGNTWTRRAMPPGRILGGQDQSRWQALAYSPQFNVVVAGGVKDSTHAFPATGSANIHLAWSNDGASWTEGTLPAGLEQFSKLWEVHDVAWNGTKFVALLLRWDTNFSTYDSAWTLTSPDGLVWDGPFSVLTVPGSSGKIAWDGSRFTTAINSAGTLGFNQSTDGVTWGGAGHPQSTVAGDPVPSMIQAAGGVYIMPSSGSQVLRSTDGLTWSKTVLVLPPPLVATGFSWRCARWDGSKFWMVGSDNSGNGAVASSPDGIGWGITRQLSGSLWSDVAFKFSNTAVPAGYYIVTSTPSSTVFTVASVGTDFSPTAAAQTVTPLTVGVVDAVPDAGLSTLLYTNATQQGITQANDVPPDSSDVAKYRNTVFYACPLRPAVAGVTLLNVGAPSGLQPGDTVFVGGGSVVASSSEDVTKGRFAVVTSSADPQQNVALTVQSFVRAVNFNAAGLGCTAVETSVQDGVPGGVAVVSLDTARAASISFSAHNAAWSPNGGITVPAQRQLNVLSYSKLLQPDAVPVLNSFAVNPSVDKRILRLLPLRDALLVFTEEGTYRLTGLEPSSFDLQPLDPTLKLMAPESCVALANTGFALTNQGFVAVAGEGRTVLSYDIEDQVLPLIGPDLLALTSQLAFGVSYESERQFTVWAPTSASDSGPSQAFVFNYHTEAWTKRTDVYRHALVNPADNRLYAVTGSQLLAERKNLDFTDYVDELVSASATVEPNLGTVPQRTDFIFQEPYSGTLASPLAFDFSAWVAPATSSLVNGYADALDMTYGGHFVATAPLAVVELSGVAPLPGDVIASGSVWTNVVSVTASDGGYSVATSPPVLFAGGPVSVYRGIPVGLRWLPSFGQNPGMRHHWREASLLFKDADFARAHVSFATDLSQDDQAVTVDGEALGIGPSPSTRNFRAVRLLVPLEKQRGSQLEIELDHTDGWRPFKLQGLSVVLETTSERISK